MDVADPAALVHRLVDLVVGENCKHFEACLCFNSFEPQRQNIQTLVRFKSTAVVDCSSPYVIRGL